MSDCLFCKIIQGTLPANKVLDETDILAFLDIRPIHAGHTLVVLKKHTENLLTTSAEDLRTLVSVLPKLCQAIQKAMAADGINVGINSGQSAGQIVPHLHLHIIPRRASAGARHWERGEYADGESAKTAEAIRQALKNLP